MLRRHKHQLSRRCSRRWNMTERNQAFDNVGSSVTTTTVTTPIEEMNASDLEYTLRQRTERVIRHRNAESS